MYLTCCSLERLQCLVDSNIPCYHSSSLVLSITIADLQRDSQACEFPAWQNTWQPILGKGYEIVNILHHWDPKYFATMNPMISYIVFLTGAVLTMDARLPKTDGYRNYSSQGHLDVIFLFIRQVGTFWSLGIVSLSISMFTVNIWTGHRLTGTLFSSVLFSEKNARGVSSGLGLIVINLMRTGALNLMQKTVLGDRWGDAISLLAQLMNPAQYISSGKFRDRCGPVTSKTMPDVNADPTEASLDPSSRRSGLDALDFLSDNTSEPLTGLLNLDFAEF
jgi:hypothetical protein